MAAVMAEYATVGPALPNSVSPKHATVAGQGTMGEQFRVRNVDVKGRIIHVGLLEVSELGVTFTFEHYPAEMIHWPLNCIRKYGVNPVNGVLALEVGRRAATGEGHFGFRADDADEICRRLDRLTGSCN